MAGTCCGRRAARVTTEGINEGIDGLRESMESASGAAGLERDPDCACDPCMCPSDDVPCNARYLGDDLSDRGLKQALDRLVRHARQIQAATSDACDCADRPPYQPWEPETPERPVPPPIPPPSPSVSPAGSPAAPRPPFVFRLSGFPPEIRDMIYEHYLADARRLLSQIAAVRVRQDRAGTETRIRRYLRNTPVGRRRFILDHRYQHQRPIEWTAGVTTVNREIGAITYESRANDYALARLGSDPLALLRVSREVRYEASAIFFQSFRFTHPRNRIRWDDWVHHGILAAETFFTVPSANLRRRMRHIELDLGAEPPVRGGPTSDVGNSSLTRPMMRNPPTGDVNWTNGLDRLGILSNTLREMEFRHLTLNFTGQPSNWWGWGVTDPRNPSPISTEPLAPWAVDLFNIGARGRLRLQLHFQLRQNNPRWDRNLRESNRYPVYNAMHTLMILRRFLLTNAQAMPTPYAGIRAFIWVTGDWDLRGTRTAEVLVECDDEFLERSNRVVSRLQRRTFGVRGQPRRPDDIMDAGRSPPPDRDPMPAPPPPPPPERADGDDEEDERNPSILGP